MLLSSQSIVFCKPVVDVHYSEREKDWKRSRHSLLYCRLHFDNGSSIVTRAVTCILYLNDVEEGGETYFPKAVPLLEPGTTREEIRSRGTGLDFTGVKIFPSRGKALFFWSKNREGTIECNENTKKGTP